MGLHRQEKCIFTGLETEPIMDGVDAIDYKIKINGKAHLIRLPYYAIKWESEVPFFRKNKYLFNALLYNDKWFENESDFIDLEKLEKLLSQADYPKTPSQKLENLFIYLYS